MKSEQRNENAEAGVSNDVGAPENRIKDPQGVCSDAPATVVHQSRYLNQRSTTSADAIYSFPRPVPRIKLEDSDAGTHFSDCGFRPCSARSCCKLVSDLKLDDPSMARTAISCTWV